MLPAGATSCRAGITPAEDARLCTAHCYERNRSRYGPEQSETLDAIGLLIRLYESWDAAEPGKGYAEKAAEYRAMLSEGDG